MSVSDSFFSKIHRAIALKEALVVGGAVRDRLLDRPILDVDVIVPKNPEKVAASLAQKMKGRSFPLDKERGILRVTLPDGRCVDIARWQEKTMEADLDRRDFTINAMAVPLSNWAGSDWKKFIIDRNRGENDLQKKLVTPVSKKIFQDDPLRLLRAFRIAAEIDFTLSKDTLALVKRDKTKLKTVAPERIREEWLKLFGTPRAYTAMASMDKAGFLDVLFPEAKILRRTAPAYYGAGGVLKHTLDSIRFFEEIESNLKSWFPTAQAKIKTYLDEKIGGHSRSAHCKWALLLHDIGKPKTARIIDRRLRFFEHEHVGADMVNKMAERYRWSSDETQRFARLVRNHMRPGSLATAGAVSDKAIFRFFRDLGVDAIMMLLVSLADHLTYLTAAQRKKRHSAHEKLTIEMVRRFYDQHDRVAPPKLLNGYDVMKLLKLPPSPMIGTLLKSLEEAQAEGKVKNRQAAVEFLKNATR